MPIVADNYEIVIGVDTHAAAHALCVVAAVTGAADGQDKFSSKPSGSRAGPHVDYTQSRSTSRPRRHRRHRLLRRRTLRPRSRGGIPSSRTLRDGFGGSERNR